MLNLLITSILCLFSLSSGCSDYEQKEKENKPIQEVLNHNDINYYFGIDEIGYPLDLWRQYTTYLFGETNYFNVGLPYGTQVSYNYDYENVNGIDFVHSMINVINDPDNITLTTIKKIRFNIERSSAVVVYTTLNIYFIDNNNTTIARCEYRVYDTSYMNNQGEYITDYGGSGYVGCFPYNTLNLVVRNTGFRINRFDNPFFYDNYVKPFLEGDIHYDSTSYHNGYDTGYTDGREVGFNEGQAVGYSRGLIDGADYDETALTIFTGIINVGLLPVNFFLEIFNYEVFGINISGLITALCTIAIVIILIRVITGAKND